MDHAVILLGRKNREWTKPSCLLIQLLRSVPGPSARTQCLQAIGVLVCGLHCCGKSGGERGTAWERPAGINVVPGPLGCTAPCASHCSHSPASPHPRQTSPSCWPVVTHVCTVDRMLSPAQVMQTGERRRQQRLGSIIRSHKISLLALRAGRDLSQHGAAAHSGDHHAAQQQVNTGRTST